MSVSANPLGPQELFCPEMTEVDNDPRSLRIAVGIATVGRPTILCETLRELQKQTRQPDCILISHCTDKDVADVRADNGWVSYIRAPLGLTSQRNAILKFAEGSDIVSFFDDDFFPAPQYLEIVEKAFQSDPRYQIITGTLLADGIRGRGIAPTIARSIIQSDSGTPTPLRAKEVYNGYGCNMSVKLSSVFNWRVFFDEDLPLYGWLEDVDFSRRLARAGRIVRLDGARGVHLGVKSGRTSGVRLGYSQIANPIYMVRRGTFSWPRAFEQMTRNVIANVAKAMFPAADLDRAGRLRGNMLAVSDLMGHRCHPKRVLEF